MSGVNWAQVHQDDFQVPADHTLSDLTTELTQLLGDPDPHLRDELALPVLATWIGRGVYDDLLTGLGDGMAAGLRVGLGERDNDAVFRRSFSVLTLAECIARDNQRPLVPGGKVLEWGDRIASWLLAEQDLRGFVAGKGWAHAIAHGADALGTLAGSPHFGAAELTVVLDVLGERVTQPADRLFGAGEPDRLALATLRLLRRNLVPIELVEPWIERLGESARLPHLSERHDPFLVTGNADAFLRSLYLQLSMGPRPPAARADLLLMVVDALKAANPRYLGPQPQ